MENNQQTYKERYEKLKNRNKSLRESISKNKKEIEKQRELLEECWERIYYKRAWLTLSDGNLKGLKRHIEEMKQDGRYDKLMLQE
jgi:hypothetical protein